MAFPGIRSADLVGIAPRAGSIASSDASTAGVASRPTLSNVAGDINPVIPMPDTYSLRLVVDRTIYDNGAAVRGTEALRALVPTSVLRVNPHDLTRIGVTSGGAVRLTSARGSEVIAVVAEAAVPRGCVALRHGTLVTTNASDSANVGNWIVDSEQVVVEVRMESL
jgi:anaerobic selenocysteine-containing dehydrogenase